MLFSRTDCVWVFFTSVPTYTFVEHNYLADLIPVRSHSSGRRRLTVVRKYNYFGLTARAM